MTRASRFVLLLAALVLVAPVRADHGNRFTYLDENNPYYPNRHFPKLVTPQWVGEEGVEAVVVLAIDDMRGHEKWETFLRPILERLKRIDGRAPVSIMTCTIDPKDEHLQKWLKEGLSLETHTIDHPCPLLQGGDFAKAKSTYDRCVDLLGSVPNSAPVAFRMPCCDSLNTPSPRFYAEIFNRTTPKGNFLRIDTSVFNILTPDDPELPRDLVLEADGTERFRKYIPAGRSFVNTIEDYPYPYVIGRKCWQFPCVTPSDWEAQFLFKPANPILARDWKAALDATVAKRGVMNLVFHPYGWSKPEQFIDLIDHAVAKHGKKVKFLTFREANERITKHLLAGQPLRADDGGDNGVRLLDLNGDGFLDVVIANDKLRQTRVWSPKTRSWTTGDFPVALVTGEGDQRRDAGGRFGVVSADGRPVLLLRNEKTSGAWRFDGSKWVEAPELLRGLDLDGKPVLTSSEGRDRGVRLRDIDHDGLCELVIANDKQRAVFGWSAEKKAWEKLPFAPPEGAALVDAEGRDRGLRFHDIDENGSDDLIWSNEDGFGLYLFTSMKDGWSRKVLAGKPGDKNAIPMIAKNGTDNGAWFHSRSVWWQNENTNLLPNLVDRRSFNQLLEKVDPAAKSPQASLQALRPRPGFAAELVVSEPLLQSPIAFAWGADGKFWVVEMGDYPLGADGKGGPGGRVKCLEDPDGKGRYTKATVFLDGLSFPTSVLPWRKGILVTCAPDILYAEDADGDGKADKVEKLYSGFVPGNPQHRVNTLARGLDNWIYCANGDSGGKVKSLKTGKVVNISGRDFRIRPDTGEIEAVTGQTQYGRTRDDWGDWFGGNNSNPAWHFALADHYLRRNPHVPPPNPRSMVVPGGPVYPISRTLPRFNDPQAANRFTSACSPTIYRDDLFGLAYAGNLFISEPVHNLVHREIVSPEGVTFVARRAADELRSEFLASSDNWFRPTTIQAGPDGALWVADMYRQVIEHPQWIPPDWQLRLDLRAGHDKGRIYRVFPVGASPRPLPRLDKLSIAELVQALDSPSGWQRDTVQQLLLWKNDKAAVPLLEKLAGSRNPLARLHALCTLDGLGALRPELVRKALDDAHPGVRRNAIRLCEGRLKDAPELGEALLKRADDPDAKVRMQLAYTLGEWDDPEAGRVLGKLAASAAGDPYLTAAALSSVNKGNLDAVLAAVLASKAPPPDLLEKLLRTAQGFGHGQATVAMLKAVAPGDRPGGERLAALAGLVEGLEQRGSSLAKLARDGDADVKQAVARLAPAFAEARTLALKGDYPPAVRLAAIRLLGHGPQADPQDFATLKAVLQPQMPDDLQSAAVANLGRTPGTEAPTVLLAAWKGLGPNLRSQALEVLLRREDGVKALLDAIEAKQVLPSEIDAARRQQLANHKSAAIRQRAARLLEVAADPDRAKVLEAYRPVLTMQGDPAKGKPLFAKHCSACHRLEGVGNAVGPDLAALSGRPADYLLTAILDPNRAVEARYVGYRAETKDGLAFTGVLTTETATSVTLVGPDGKPQTILRADLDRLASTGKSAMPEGLEKDVPKQEMADLLAYLRANIPTPKPKVQDGNRPELVKPASGGELRLTAAAAEIYGPTLVFEKQYGNLGYWDHPDDFAAWSVEVPKAGRYRARLDWACDRGSAGQGFALETESGRLEGKVPGTGSWDVYKQADFGVVALPAGRSRVTFRSAGVLKGPLIDLRAVRLVLEK